MGPYRSGGRGEGTRGWVGGGAPVGYVGNRRETERKKSLRCVAFRCVALRPKLMVSSCLCDQSGAHCCNKAGVGREAANQSGDGPARAQLRHPKKKSE